MTAKDLAARLPDIGTLRAWWQTLAVLDAIMSPEWDYRYFSFDTRWGDGQQMASMRNGSGDDCSVTFTPAGAYLRGFDHESTFSPWTNNPPALLPGLLDDVPDELRDAALDPAWQLAGVPSVTFSLWRLVGDDRWHHANARTAPAGADDGSDELFEVIDGRPESYVAFATYYYEPERPLDLAAVERIFAHEPMTSDLARLINPGAEWKALTADLDVIGYPAQPARPGH